MNLVELFWCLDDRIAPPPVSISAFKPSIRGASDDTAMLAVPSSPAETVVLVTMLKFCLQVLRNNPSESVVFTHDQVDRLLDCIPDYDSRKLRKKSFSLETSLATGNSTNKAIQESEAADDHCSDSDNEDVRLDIKKNTSETLQQVEALFHTLETKQQIQATRVIARPLGLSALAIQAHDLKNEKPLNYEAKLAAAQAFFKEQRLHQRQEQQQRREFQATLVIKTIANDCSGLENSTTKASATAAVLAGGVPRKRSNVVVLASAVGALQHQPKPHQHQQSAPRKPHTSVIRKK